MKIAVATDDGTSVAGDFGTARQYLVFTMQDGQITERELRSKAVDARPVASEEAPRDPHDRFAGHRVGPGPRSRYDEMAAAVGDCEAVLAREMGTGALRAFRGYGIEPVVTDERGAEQAVLRYLRENG